MSNGKGSKRRPRCVSEDEWSARWALAFEKTEDEDGIENGRWIINIDGIKLSLLDDDYDKMRKEWSWGK